MPENTPPQTQGRKMVAALKRNISATVNLTGAMINAVKSQETLSKLSISTGNSSMMATTNLSKTFNNVGMSLNESVKMFTSMSQLSLDMTDQSTKDTLARTTKLGKDLGAHAKSIALNSQTLGLSKTASLDLQDTFLEVGAAYHMDSDILVQAMGSLASTIIQSAAVYGKGTALALQEASVELIGRYGAGNADLIKEMTTALFGGTEKSTKMAAMLGLDINKLASTDKDSMISMFDTALKSLQAKVGGAAGGGESGFTVPKLLAAFGATPGMLQLASLGPQTAEQLAIEAEAMEAQHLQTALMSSLESIMKDLTVMILPLVDLLGMVLRPISFALTAMGGLLQKLIIATVASKVVLKAASLVHSMMLWVEMRKQSFAVQSGNTTLGKILVATLKSGASKGMGMMGGPWGIGLTLGLTALSFLPMLFGNSEEDKNTSKDILSEQEKQTAALYDNEQSKILGSLAREMMQANMYNERLVIEAEHRNELAQEANDIKHDAPEEMQSFSNDLTATPNSK